MADVDYEEFEQSGTGGDPGPMALLVNWIGAAVSFGLLAGLGVWGYNLSVRDVTDVPVIRAMEGPMRVQPEDPGGDLAEHQGMAVNAVQAEGVAEEPASRIILAPQPIDLAANNNIVISELPEEEPVIEAREPVERPLSGDEAVAAALALAEKLSAGMEPLDGAAVTDTRTDEAEDIAAVARPADTGLQVISQSIPGVKTSPRPALRPNGLQASTKRVASRTETVAAVIDIAPADVAPGTRLVQLGAYDSAETARREWGKFAERFSAYMAGKKRVIQKTQSGGRTFYRLRAHGFDGLSEARRFCSVLLAEDAACIPVVSR